MSADPPLADAVPISSDEVIVTAGDGEPLFDGALGNDESMWSAALSVAAAFDLSVIRHAAIISPHPDDEVLALGGTMAMLTQLGIPITLVSVTDGEGSHPNVAGLAEIRARERDAALVELGCQPRLVRLGIPDGAVWQATDLADRIARELGGVSHVFAPLEFDGHPDHDAVGTAARDASARTASTLVRYAVWAWHWARVDRLPFERSAAIELGGDVRDRKRRAINAYRSQITMFEGTRILYPAMLDHFARPFETVFV